MIKPSMKQDWDKNRKVVTNQYGERFVLFNEEAKRLFRAANRIYKRRI